MEFEGLCGAGNPLAHAGQTSDTTFVVGQERRSCDVRDMSGLPPIADMVMHGGKRRYGPGPDSCSATTTGILFDHLVGPGEQCSRHFEAESLSGFEIERRLVFSRRL